MTGAGRSRPAAPPVIIAPPQAPRSLRNKRLIGLAALASMVPAAIIVGTHWPYFSRVLAPVAGAGIEMPTAGSIGDSRRALLDEISREYDGPDAARLNATGDLAPADYLNRVLALRNVKWRVRKVEGHYAELYEVS